eukprot:5906634-Pleurochrysis_carterae.AAC.1
MGSKPGSRVEYESPCEVGQGRVNDTEGSFLCPTRLCWRRGSYVNMPNMARKRFSRVNITRTKCLFRQFNARQRLPG